MIVEIVDETAEALQDYATIRIAFTVTSRLRVDPLAHGLGGLALIEERIEPYIKDYDSAADEGPLQWARRRDTSAWGILGAFAGPQRVGGAAVVWRTTGFRDLEERDDLAVLLDLRVHPDHRGRGVGRQLFARAEAWARERGCAQLKIETQNVNVPACRFYARQGCELGAIHRFAYPGSDEAQLLWYKQLH